MKRFRSLQDHYGNKPLIVHIGHESENPKSPLHPDSPGVAFQEYARPEGPAEPIFSKTVNSAFIGTTLEQTLRGHEIRRLYVVGLTTDHCVSTTVRMAGNLKVTDWVDGKDVKHQGDGIYLVEDASAAHAKGGFDADLVHAVHAESLKEFATVVTTSELLKNLGGLICENT